MEKYINDAQKFNKVTLNRLIVPDEGIIVQVPPRDTYVLVVSDLENSNEPFDLAVDLVIKGKKPNRSVVGDHYLMPYLYCVGMNWEDISELIGESAASENPFLRYFVKNEDRSDPFLYNRDAFMLGEIFVASALEPQEYSLVDVKKIIDNNPPAFEKYRETLRQKQEIIDQFF